MRRRFLVPEVVQTSGDGTAALACRGFGLQASYGRLREACQTGVDGTSTDTIEDFADQLGLDAEQVMIAAEDVVDPRMAVLPAIVITRQPSGFTHFVVAWRLIGPYVMVMDPAVGRRLVRRRRFVADCYIHRMPVPAAVWWAAASSPSAISVLVRRLGAVGMTDATVRVDAIVRGGEWSPPAHLHAVARFLRAAGRGRRVGWNRSSVAATQVTVPEAWWAVLECPAGDDEGEQVLLSGAVPVRASGRRTRPSIDAVVEQDRTASGPSGPFDVEAERAGVIARSWPPTDDDLIEARQVCDELGLGPLLARMPAGLEQPVGECGWQLSHGERSRVFVARALLQRTEVIVLDESFAALDPEALRTTLDTVLRRIPTVVAIAHE